MIMGIIAFLLLVGVVLGIAFFINLQTAGVFTVLDALAWSGVLIVGYFVFLYFVVKFKPR